MEKGDTEAIRAVLAGDPECYRVLLDRHYPGVFRIAFRITGNPEDAEEAAQDTFLRAYTKLAGFRHDSSFSTWITRIAMNTALNLVERRSRDLTRSSDSLSSGAGAGQSTPDPADHHAGPERLLLNGELTSLRRDAMAALTPMERTAFTLRHMEDVPIAEIAVALRIPANSAKQAVFRAVTKLRRSLAPLAGGLR